MDEELSPEVEEKETFGCWVCDERMGFKKLVNHLRAHSQTEKMLAYTTQVTQERKERDGKNGKPRQSGSHLQEGDRPLPEQADARTQPQGIGSESGGDSAPSKEVHDPSGRPVQGVSEMQQHSKGHLEAKAITEAASIANL